jgi:cellobiose epimerase
MTRGHFRLLFAVFLGAVLLPRAGTAALADQARDFQSQLANKILPYWYDSAQDTNHGGYLLADDLKGRGTATEKQLVSQARMVWGFSQAHRKGFSTDQRNYLQAASQGYRFLLDHFLDTEQGGYFWKTDLTGQVTNSRKIVYGQSFVIYALVEYHRASGDPAALRRALDLYQVLQQRAHDTKNQGWVEHFERDWTPLPPRDPAAEVEVAGFKSANTHLHLMEALAELCEDSRSREVRVSLEEAVQINRTYFYPRDPGRSAFHCQPNWSPVTDPRSAGLSYGHNVEFAWLLIRAEQVLKQRPSWAHFDAHVNHALKYGYDHERGGSYYLGQDNQPATNTDKIWWVQSELMAALTDGLRHKKNPAYVTALEKLVSFVNTYQADPRDGIWLDTVTADGRPKNTGKAHSWKANYHDVRALVKFVYTFDPSRK